jgi:hypothetical protein
MSNNDVRIESDRVGAERAITLEALKRAQQGLGGDAHRPRRPRI